MIYHSNIKTVIKTLILSVIIVFCSVTYSGCATVKRELVVATQPSWDGTNQNSGFIGFTNGNYGIITSNLVERQKLLIKKYGDKFLPPIKENDGLTAIPPYFTISPEALERLIRMNRWHKTGVK